jgi:hypothetical protein
VTCWDCERGRDCFLHGPVYPKLGERVQKARRDYAAGRITRKDYGSVVHAAFVSLNTPRVVRSEPAPYRYSSAAHRGELAAAFQAAVTKDFREGVKGLHAWSHTATCGCELCQS